MPRANCFKEPDVRAKFLAVYAAQRSFNAAYLAVGVSKSVVAKFRVDNPQFEAEIVAIKAQPIVYRRRPQSFTVKQRNAFLDALAESGCADRAAREVGLFMQTAYALRNRDMAFAAAWAAARDEGYDRAHGRLLHQAIHGFVNVDTTGGIEKRQVRHEGRLVLAMLDRHARSQGRGGAMAQVVELTPERVATARRNLLMRLSHGGSLTTMAEAIAAAAATPATVGA